MSMQDIYNKTYDFVNNFKQTDEYKELMVLKEKIDTQLKEKVEKFNHLKEKYEECQKYGKHHPDLIKIQKELSEAKASLFSEELVIKYKEMEKTLEANLNNVLKNICTKVSSKIKNKSSMSGLMLASTKK